MEQTDISLDYNRNIQENLIFHQVLSLFLEQ